MRQGVMRALRDFRVSVRDLNGEVGFAVEEAETGEAAVERILAKRPDIVLLDHKLPGISGLEVLDKVQGAHDDMLAVMITAYASLETAVAAIKHGAYDFLAKPFTPGELKNTIRKAAESLILARQARRLAQEKRQMRFQFISVLAHELKAPLGAVESYLQVMKDRTAGDDPKVYEHMIERSLIRTAGMRKLIVDLLDLTRIESGLKTRELTDVDVREVAKSAMEAVSVEAGQRGIALELHADAPVILRSDRGEIEIILNNLITNAVKYNRDNGRVDVTITRDSDGVEITVADTGIGLSAEECAKLFQDFVRIKNEKTRNILGSGLGLSIVRKLANLYGGDATVESKPGVGSTFRVKLCREAETKEVHA
jgi:signal transduction histidine kinase